MVDYRADLPPGVTLPDGFSVNTDDPRYKALRDLAVRENLSQRAFTAILGVEAQRVTGEYERARAAAPAPAAPAPAAKPDFSKMSTANRFAYALANGPTRTPLPKRSTSGEPNMTLSINPSLVTRNTPTRSAPIDAAATFCLNSTLTASAWLTGAATSPITLPAGRTQGLWMLQIQNLGNAALFPSNNEFYQFFLYGSNDPNFAAGNCDLLGVYDLAATAALRLGSPAGQGAPFAGFGGSLISTPPLGLQQPGAAIYAIPVGNDRDIFVLQFMNAFVNIGGTTPSITVSSWFSPWSGQKM
jgi:hypothetical protein